VARGFIEAMGGTLTADNRPAGGARFLIELPVQQPAKS
jgi:signal transduction histidine kinase